LPEPYQNNYTIKTKKHSTRVLSGKQKQNVSVLLSNTNIIIALPINLSRKTKALELTRVFGLAKCAGLIPYIITQLEQLLKQQPR